MVTVEYSEPCNLWIMVAYAGTRVSSSPNGYANPSDSVERFGWRFSPGDRVMETQNDYDQEVLNGDLGMTSRPSNAAIITLSSSSIPHHDIFKQLFSKTLFVTVAFDASFFTA